jgi:histidinol-phosphate aminotransferase
VRLNAEGRRLLSERLGKLGCHVLPSQGNFLCFLPPRPAAEICEHLFHQGVIVRPLIRFGLAEWIRVTMGTPTQNAHFLNAIAAFTGGLKI